MLEQKSMSISEYALTDGLETRNKNQELYTKLYYCEVFFLDFDLDFFYIKVK